MLAGIPLLGWAIVAPWVWGYQHAGAAHASHIALSMAAIPLCVLAAALPAVGALVALAGLWLALSPWVLGYAAFGVAAWANDLIGGSLLMLAATLTIRTRSKEKRPARRKGESVASR